MDKQDQIISLNKQLTQLQNQGQWDQYVLCLDSLFNIKKKIATPQEMRSFENKYCTFLNKWKISKLQLNSLNEPTYSPSIVISLKQSIQAITLNNLACYFRKTGKFRVALNYLKEALAIELMQLPNLSMQQLSETYLNLCAVLSQLDRHDEALNHIYLSIIMMQHQLLLTTLKTFDIESIKERLASLVVGYNNLAVELEYLKHDLESKKVFSVASSFAQEYLPNTHQMVEQLKKNPPSLDLKFQPPSRSHPQSPCNSYKDQNLLKSQFNSKEIKRIKLHQLYIPGLNTNKINTNKRSLSNYHSKTKSVEPSFDVEISIPRRLEQQQFQSLQKYLSLVD